MSTPAPASLDPSSNPTRNYLLTQLDEVTPVRCPCGYARRGFAIPENKIATIHMVDIETDAQVHYHKCMTEIYLVLEGTGHLELDGERVPVKPMTSVMIKPGCRHRAVGKLKIINIPIPAFDPADEWFD
jgi:mannose-6-phosphate isomerase-like protein (cupin superfamily)